MRAANGRLLEFSGGVSRPGIFGVDLEVEHPGVYEMTLRVDAAELQDLHAPGPVTVHPSGESLPASDDEDGGSISFLKEQQWTLEFGTALVELRRLRSSITGSCTFSTRCSLAARHTSVATPLWIIHSKVRAASR